MNFSATSLQLLSQLAADTFTEEDLKTYKYKNLLDLRYLLEELPAGKGGELFASIRQRLTRMIAHTLLKKQRRLVVGIFTCGTNDWIGDELYHLLENSDVFRPYIFTLRVRTKSKEDEDNQRGYDVLIRKLQEHQLRFIETFDSKHQRDLTWDELPVHPDICLWLNPWMGLFSSDMYVWNHPLTTLQTYIPYGFPTTQNPEHTFHHFDYNQDLHNLCWLIFTVWEGDPALAKIHCFSGAANMRYTGYPKMDAYFTSCADEPSLFGRLLKENGTPHAKKIIYSPHHSMRPEDILIFSTFADNGRWMLELAKKYQKETVWVFKPHPQLAIKAIRYGIFRDEKEWDAYVAAWNALPNATVQLSGNYHRLFKESDAIINDSGSFIAEYLFVNKPMLELRRPEQGFTELSEMILPHLYQVNGKDTAAIERFLKDIVLAGNDPKRAGREAFFAEHLDYYHALGGHTAAENIFGTLYTELCADGGLLDT